MNAFRLRHRLVFAGVFAWVLSWSVVATTAAETKTEKSTSTPTERAVVALLTAQSVAWNRGDIDGFMQGYAPTDELRFASGGTVTYGWRATLERYKKSYPDKATMGTLAFSEIVVTELAPDAALAFGRWELTREKDKPSGLFTLTLRKFSAGWCIIQDHTSSAK